LEHQHSAVPGEMVIPVTLQQVLEAELRAWKRGLLFRS
jgi:hypothetical protein